MEDKALIGTVLAAATSAAADLLPTRLLNHSYQSANFDLK
jgi:hypothetical protein